jgi:hypothetical protein
VELSRIIIPSYLRILICATVFLLQQVGYGVTANIAASHAAARGSIPRIRIIFFLLGSTNHFSSSS